VVITKVDVVGNAILNSNFLLELFYLDVH